jgi:hypothetical protein
MNFMRKENAGVHKALGEVKHLTLHWTAGGYETTYNHYHINIQGDGDVVQTLSTKYQGSHCWYRNSNNIGLTFCAMGSDKTPVTAIQIERMAAAVADLCGIFGLDIDGKVALPAYRRIGANTPGDRLVPTGKTILAPVVSDHAFFAKADSYYPDRWDVGELMGKVLTKARWYRTQTLEGKRENELQGKLN